jgi:hypothetical protein
MADALRRYGGPVLLALLILAVGAAMLVGWQRYNRDYVVTVGGDEDHRGEDRRIGQPARLATERHDPEYGARCARLWLAQV